MSDELSKQKEITVKRARSLSVGDDINKLDDTDIIDIENSGRRALYGTLPFFATFGMSSREMSLRDVISRASSNAVNLISSVGAKKSPTTTEREKRLAVSRPDQLADVDVDEIIMTVPLMMAVLVAIISQFLVGFNTGVVNPSAPVVFPGHSTAEWSLAVAAFAVGGPGGAVLGGLLANQKGRRAAILINSWIFFVGGVMMTLAPNVYFLIPSRLVIGFAAGLSSVVVPVYLGEMAPPTMRGTLGTCTQFAIVIGILASGLLGLLWATPSGWRILFAVTPVLCAIQLLVSPLLLESPRWLLNQEPASLEARVVIKKIRGFRTEAAVETEVQHFLFAADKHKTSRTSAHSSEAMWDLLTNPDLRVLVVSCVVLQMAQQLCGINAVFYYSTTFFEGIISNPLVGTNCVALVNVLSTYIALLLMDRTARRTLLLWSAGGMVVSAIVIIVALKGYMYNYVALLAVMSFVSFFEIGLGPIPWLIVAEMFDSKYVATAMSISCIVNWACNFLIGLLFPFLQLWLGPWSFAPFTVVLSATFMFTLFYLPETHGRSVEEIQRLAQDPMFEEFNPRHTIQAVESYDLYNAENT